LKENGRTFFILKFIYGPQNFLTPSYPWENLRTLIISIIVRPFYLKGKRTDFFILKFISGPQNFLTPSYRGKIYGPIVQFCRIISKGKNNTTLPIFIQFSKFQVLLKAGDKLHLFVAMSFLCLLQSNAPFRPFWRKLDIYTQFWTF
jgi:hypothetical protein